MIFINDFEIQNKENMRGHKYTEITKRSPLPRKQGVGVVGLGTFVMCYETWPRPRNQGPWPGEPWSLTSEPWSFASEPRSRAAHHGRDPGQPDPVHARR